MLRVIVLVCGFLGTMVHADEVWDTGDGRVVYLADQGDVAIWEAETLDGAVRYYVPGLAGNYDSRAVHDGYWIKVTGPSCGATLVGADGFQGESWGRLMLVFHGSGFPTNWTMMTGSCFDSPETHLRGQSPLLAAE